MLNSDSFQTPSTWFIFCLTEIGLLITEKSPPVLLRLIPGLPRGQFCFHHHIQPLPGSGAGRSSRRALKLRADSGTERDEETQGHCWEEKRAHRGTGWPGGQWSLCWYKVRTRGARPKVMCMYAMGWVPGIRGYKEKHRGGGYTLDGNIPDLQWGISTVFLLPH